MSNKYVNPAKEDSQYTGTTYKCKLKTFESRPSDSHKLLLSYVLLFKYVLECLLTEYIFFTLTRKGLIDIRHPTAGRVLVFS